MNVIDLENTERPLVICLMGPTAVGKSDFAIELANHLPIEIISVDSVMVYKGLDIGTGKPSMTQRCSVPHHLLDIREPNIPYSAAEFSKDARRIIPEILKRGRVPVLVGGTSLYFKALQEGLSLLPSADPIVRAELMQEAQQMGWPNMHQYLQTVDPVSAAKIHPNDPQRIQRALEVYRLTQKPMSVLLQAARPWLSDYQIRTFALHLQDRHCLHQRIAQRFHHMLANGVIAEVEALLQREDMQDTLPALRAVGYRQIVAYLRKETDKSTMIDRAIAATRQLAKRQLTWLRHSTDTVWLLNNYATSARIVLHYLT